MAFDELRADLKRCEPREWLTEPSIWAIAVYRVGQWIDERSSRRLLLPVYGIVHMLVQLATGISIPKSAVIGPGFRVFHFGGVVVHPATVIGANVTIGHGVTLGVREREDEAPTIESDVVLGAYAQVLGGVKIGRGAKVGAMSVVLSDIPSGARAAGIPARVLGESPGSPNE
jgi:serine O-acetyltransferase